MCYDIPFLQTVISSILLKLNNYFDTCWLIFYSQKFVLKNITTLFLDTGQMVGSGIKYVTRSQKEAIIKYNTVHCYIEPIFHNIFMIFKTGHSNVASYVQINFMHSKVSYGQ